MKQIVLFVLALMLVQPAAAQGKTGSGKGIEWKSFNAGMKEAKQSGKKVLIDVYTDWCGWCKKMDAETFANPYIAKYMSDHFYCVKLDAERKDTVVLDGQTFTNTNPTGKRGTHKLAIDLLKGKMSYPSYVFLNEQGQKLTVLAGYQKAPDFEVVLTYFGSDAYLKNTWEEFRGSFQGKLK